LKQILSSQNKRHSPAAPDAPAVRAIVVEFSPNLISGEKKVRYSMKWKIYTYVFILSSISIMITTCPAFSTIQPGIEAGVNYISNNYDDPLESWESTWRIGYSFGGTIQIALARNIDLKTGLRLVQLGNKVEFNVVDNSFGGEFSGDFKVIQNYASLPLFLKINTNSSPEFFFQLGPEFGYLISAKAKRSETMMVESLDNTVQNSADIDISDDLESYNISLGGGVGVYLPIHSHTVSLHADYSHGLTGTAKESEWISNWKTRELRVSIGYLF
jgi:hypothetical protein